MAPMEMLWGVLVHLFYFSSRTLAFNVDTNVPIVKEGKAASYFGFSVAQHQIARLNGIGTTHVLLVGAPKDNITDARFPKLHSLNKPGQLWRCPVTSFTEDCEPVTVMDTVGNPAEVADQWLGVNVVSQGSASGMALVCAHRFKVIVENIAVYGNGICYSLSNVLDFNDYREPCAGKKKEKGYQQFGLCQAGTSAAVSTDGDIIVGTPGAYTWRGGLFREKLRHSLGEEGGWKNNPIADPLPIEKDVPPPTGDYYSYMGMASEIGRVLPGDLPTFIAGAPRSKDTGQVFLFQDIEDQKYLQTKPMYQLSGDKFGSAFGYSLALVDFNGDGAQDLVVGAPFYFEERVGGAIYVYMNDGGNQGITDQTKPTKITSRKMDSKDCKMLNCHMAQFGIALANLGDIDKDGFEDLAVGAPFEGSGCVYIFLGHIKGIVEKYSQRIAASDLLSARPLATFGYSLVGGNDMDGNEYPDLAVGAFDSNKVVLLRTRPVIKIQSVMQPLPNKISPEVKRCPSNGRGYNCFRVRCCFKFTAEPKNRFRNKLTIDYRLEAEKFTGRALSRVFFEGKTGQADNVVERSTQLFEQTHKDLQCEEEMVYIKKANKDFLNPIQFRLTYSLTRQETPTMTVGQQLPDINQYPVINQAEAHEDLSVDFVKNCGTDNKCHSNLDIKAAFLLDIDEEGDAVLKVGQVDELRLRVIIRNQGEDAHETVLTVIMPDSESISFIQTEPRSISCSPNEERTEITCSNIGNPLPKNGNVSFDMRLNPKNIRPSLRVMDVRLRVNTTSEETDTANDFVNLRIKVVVETDMLVRGSSLPTEMFYGGEIRGESAIKYEDQIGNHVVHNYEVKNAGQGKVGNSTLYISWPYEVQNGYPQGKHLLYLMEEPEVEPPARCYLESWMVNPLHIEKQPDEEDIENVELGSHTDGQENSERLRRRVKRENVITPEYVTENGRQIRVVKLDCLRKTAKCFRFPCVLGEMPAGKSIAIKLRARLWNSTFLEDYRDVDHVQISSRAELVIDEALNVQQDTSNDIASATLRAVPDISSVEQPGVQIWVYVIAGCAGLVLLIVIIILLYKCGFFKRSKPDDMRKHRAKVHKQNKKNKNAHYFEDDYS